MIRSLLLAWKIFRYIFLLTLLVVFFSHTLVVQAAFEKIVADPALLPHGSVALLLGTSRYTRSGRPNEFFLHRIQAAVDALDSGRVDLIIASGDSLDPGYDEPRSMFAALTERGVPPEKVLLDHGGTRTLDSIYRMQTVFGYDRFVVISQQFHLERALFIASHRGIDAIGFAAPDAAGFLNLHIRLREYLARVQAVLDVYVLRPEPSVLPDQRAIEFSSASDVNSTDESGY